MENKEIFTNTNNQGSNEEVAEPWYSPNEINIHEEPVLEITKERRKVTIEGNNLDKQEAEFYGDLKHTGQEFSEQEIEILNRIETIYKKSEMAETAIESLPIDEEGKIRLIYGKTRHHIVKNKENYNQQEGKIKEINFETLKNVSELGLRASEWFGVPESEKEGSFCTFISTFVDPEKPHPGIVDPLSANTAPSVLFLFDQNNSGLEPLLKLDFFQYLRNKAEAPETIDQKYSEEDLEILEFINTKSRGLRMAINRRAWSAIPGGIPSRYINGVCLPSPSEEDVYRAAELFPNATIFNKEKTVLYRP